jgi:hypothetical protein
MPLARIIHTTDGKFIGMRLPWNPETPLAPVSVPSPGGGTYHFDPVGYSLVGRKLRIWNPNYIVDALLDEET